MAAPPRRLSKRKRGNGRPFPRAAPPALGRWSLHRLHRDGGAPACARLELDMAFREGEEGVVAPHPHIVTGVEFGAALPDQDISRNDDLTAELLDPQPPAGGVAAVAGAAACLFMCHGPVLLIRLLRLARLLGTGLAGSHLAAALGLASGLLCGRFLGGSFLYRGLPLGGHLDGGLLRSGGDSGRSRNLLARPARLYLLRRHLALGARRDDLRDAQHRDLLAMAALAAVIVTTLLLEDEHCIVA